MHPILFLKYFRYSLVISAGVVELSSGLMHERNENVDLPRWNRPIAKVGQNRVRHEPGALVCRK